MGADVIRVSVMLIGKQACTRDISCTSAKVTLRVMSGIGTGADSFATCDALSKATSFISLASGSQKKENSEVTLFDSSASGFQKKEKSEMCLGCRDTRDVVIFV